MHLEGDQDFPLPVESVFKKLSDAAFLVHCLKDVEIIRAEADTAAWKLRPALSFVAGTLDTSLTITERTAPTAMLATVFSKGIGATTTVQTALAFASHENGTRIHWTLDLTQATGLLKLVPKSLMQGAAQKVIEDVWAQIAARITHECQKTS